MNLLHFTSAFFGRVLTATASASLLALIVLGIQMLFGRRLGPAWRHALWLIVLARLLVPAFPESRFSLFNAPRWFQRTTKPERHVKVEILTPSVPTEPVQFETLPPDTTPLPLPEPPPPAKPSLTPWELCGLLWLAASIVLLLRLLAGNCWLHLRLARNRLLLDPAVLRSLSEARWRMRTAWNPRPVETRCVNSPGLFGVLRPRILLPPDTAQQLSETELRHVFLHELAHLKRGDLWVNLLMNIVHVLHWFNPLVWFVLRRLRLERELACDALVLRATPSSETHSYGETILKLLERITPRPVFAPVIGILEEKRSAASRLNQIANFNPNKPPSRLLGLALLATLALIGLSNAQTEKRDSTAPQDTFSKQKTEPVSKKSRGVEIIQKEYDTQKALVQDLQKQVDQLRVKYHFADNSADEVVRDLRKTLNEADARRAHFEKLSDELHARNLTELRKILPTVAPDAALDRYLVDLGKVEQQYASNIGDLGPEHPEIVKLQALLKTINQQIEDRIDGILTGIDLQVQQNKAVASELQNRLRDLRTENDKEYEDYLVLKRKLETEQGALNFLYLRLLSEKIDSQTSNEKQDLPPSATGNPSTSSILVHQARAYMEVGDLDRAETKLNQALTVDPNDGAASYYLNLVKERGFAIEARKREADANPIIATGGPLAPDSLHRITSADPPIFDPSRALLDPLKKAVNPLDGGNYDVRTYPTRNYAPSWDRAEGVLQAQNVDPRSSANDVRATEVNQQRDSKAVGFDWYRGSTRTRGDARSANRPQTSGGIATINRKLDAIILEKYEVPGDLELSEVAKDLQRFTSERDVDKVGVNLIISSFLDKPPVLSPEIDHFTGQPPVPVRAKDYKITIDPPLHNVSLRSILDAIVRTAKPPEGADPTIGIKYSIEDYAIVFSRADPRIVPLYTRTYKFDPATFQHAINRVSPPPNVTGTGTGGGIVGILYTNQLTTSEAVRNFFVAAGVQFDPKPLTVKDGQPVTGQAQQKAMFYNDKTGVLMVRATLADLDKIENAIQLLTLQPQPLPANKPSSESGKHPEPNPARHPESVPSQNPPFGGGETNNKAVSFDWYLGNTLMASGKSVTQRVAAADLQSALPQPKPESPKGPKILIEAKWAEILIEAKWAELTGPNADIWAALGLNDPPASVDQNTDIKASSLRMQPGAGWRTNDLVGTKMSAQSKYILSPPQYQVLVHSLEQRTGVDLLNAPRLTTLSGREAQIRVTEAQTIMTGISTNLDAPKKQRITYTSESIDFGTTLRLLANVLDDGNISLKLDGQYLEFMGYDDPGTDGQIRVWENGKNRNGKVPLPVLREQTYSTETRIRNHQAILLCGLGLPNKQKTSDKVPVLGDIPALGRLFRSEGEQTTTKFTLLMLTAEILPE